jgi:glycosyltransferase involved in cell wall biosynthesis
MIHDSLITAQDPFETGLVGYWLKKKFGVPLQLQVHTDFMSPYFRAESLKNRLRYWLGKWLIKKADCVRVVSQRILNSLKAISLPAGRHGYKLKADSLPIFVDIQKIKDAPIVGDLRRKYPGRFIILMASRLSKEKNISLAIEAMARIAKSESQGVKPLLLIVGNGPERKNLELGIRNYELDKNVVLENWTGDLSSYYKTSDLFLLTSNYEGYGRTVVEALAADLPVVMTDVGLAGELVKNNENGLMVPVGDAAALSEAIKKSMEPTELARWRSNSQKHLPKLNKEESLAMYKKIWESC